MPFCRIGSTGGEPTDILAPWPSWCLAATHQTPSTQIQAFLSALQPYISHFDSSKAREDEDVQYVVKTFGQQEKDVREWLGTVRYAEKLDQVKGDVLHNTLRYVLHCRSS
jgi:hypothetical protein